MATLTPVQVTNAGATVAPQATAAGGDEFVFGGNRQLITFTNGHVSAITVNFPPVAAGVSSSAGIVAPPTRSQAIAAGAQASFLFSPGDAPAYLNASGRIPVTYTGHNALLVVRAVDIP